jgi:23S rRNA pseudouridine2605 synthase
MVEKGERIAKRLARAGLCSRRDAERWIAEGRVAVGGKVLESPALTVMPGDDIRVDGKPLPSAEPARLWRYHKPPGLVTSHRDPQGRPTVFERLPGELPRVVSVGRLDLNSEGLLLVTNDGGLARALELPSRGWLRRYRLRVHGAVDPARLATLEQGVTIGGVTYGPIRATLDRQQASNAWLTVSLREGKNREIRRVMEHLGLDVTRLIRIAYGPFQLGELPRGAVEEVPRRVLREQLGEDAPIRHAHHRRPA